jgi:hypothetical protein
VPHPSRNQGGLAALSDESDLRLVRGFDGIIPYPPICLFASRLKVLCGCRIVECLRLLQAVPLVDSYALGCLALERNNLAARSVEVATAGSLDRSDDKRGVGSLGSAIERYGFDDGVGFRLGLSVQPCTAAAPSAAPASIPSPSDICS